MPDMVNFQKTGTKTQVCSKLDGTGNVRYKVNWQKEHKKYQEQILDNKNILQLARRLKWDWAGHLSRLENNRWSKIIIFWQLKGGRRPGKQRVRWTDDINKFLRHKLYHRIAANWTEWARLREAFAQKQGHKL